MYDITKESTFKNVGKWVDALHQNAGANVAIMLVGNKLDIVKISQMERKVPLEIATLYAEKNNMQFFEASAYDQTNIKEAFENLLDRISIKQIYLTKGR